MTAHSAVDVGETAPKRQKSNWKKWLAIIVALLVVVGVVIGIVVWKTTSKKDNSRGQNSGSGSKGDELDTANYIGLLGTSGVVKSDPSDPSKFEKDTRLTRSFYGMAYVPWGAHDETNCQATLANVTQDIQLLSQLTHNLRLYGSGCDQTGLTLQAISDTKSDLLIMPAVYVSRLEPEVTVRQFNFVLDAVRKYGVKNINGIIIGNEVILNYADPTFTGNYNQTSIREAIDTIIQTMEYMRGNLTALNMLVDVGTSDAGSAINARLTRAADFILPNIHPFIGGLGASQAAEWTWGFFEGNNVIHTNGTNTKAYIGEVGWPTDSLTAEDSVVGNAVAGVPQSQTFMDSFVCPSNSANIKYFYFEPFDEPWKAVYGGVEPFWGIFDANRVLKNLRLPDCSL